MFQFVRIRFQCASRIVDLRHIEIIKSLSKLKNLSIHFVTNIDFKVGGVTTYMTKKLILVTFSKYPK